MKTAIKILFPALMLLAISCKKENITIQSSSTTGESATQALSSDANANEFVGAGAVRIGTQVWKIKNLDVTRYRNGDRIPQVKDRAEWAALTTGAWCWYNNDSANGAIYGKLYNWYAIYDPRGLAPAGWHIPSDAEWDKLSTFLGDNAGGKMKSTGTIEAGTGLWYAPNTDATNSSGFTGLPGGARDKRGRFNSIGNIGDYWSLNGWFYGLHYNDSYLSRYGGYKKNGLSVRCLRD